MSKPNKKKQSNTQPTNSSDSAVLSSLGEHIEEIPTRKRGLVFWGVVALVVLLVAVLLAPTIVTRTSLRQYVIAKAVPADTAIISMKSMKAGWFAPLDIEGLRVLDSAGAPLLEVDRIQGDRTILDLARDYTNIGQLTVDAPTVHLLLRPDGSNLEDVIAKLAGESTETDSTTTINANLKITNGRVIATEQATNTTWKIEQLNVEAALPKDAAASWIAKVNGTLDGQSFSLATATPMGLATEKWPLGPTGELRIKTQSLSLAPVRYAALRAGQPIEHLQGALTVDVVSNWQPATNAEMPQLNAVAQMQIDNLQVASRTLLGKDVLVLNQTHFRGDTSIANDIIQVKDCTLSTDFGNTSLVTTAELSKLMDPNAMVEAIRKQRLQTSGKIDVAALTRTLPNTLKIRDDVDVASGLITWQAHSEAGAAPGAPTRWTGDLKTENIQVLRGGKAIDWKFPLEVSFAVLDGEEVEIENVLAKSPGLFSLTGNGKLRAGNLRAEADLEKLVYELGQVIDMNGMYVSGGLRSAIQWQETQPNQIDLKAQTNLDEFVMTQNEQILCREQKLITVVAAKATLDGQDVASLDTGRVDVVSAGDVFVAELQSAVAKPATPQATWPVLCRLKGELSTWFARLKPFGADIGWDLAGQIDTTTLIAGNQRGVAIQRLVADIRNLEAVTEGIRIREPVIQVESSGTIDLTTFACRFPNTTVTSHTIAMSADKVAVDMEPHFVVAGDIGYQANVERLMAYMSQDPAVPSTQKISGHASGRLHLESKAETTSFQLTSAIEDLRIDQISSSQDNPMSQPTTTWQEPKLTLQATGAYDAVKDRLDLSNAQVAGKVLNLAAQGNASQLMTQPAVDLAGEYGYDLDGLMAIFGEMLGNDIRLAGNQKQKFVVRGPLFPAVANAKTRVSNELLAQAGAGWQSANVYNTALGPAQIDAQLSQGVLQMSPLQLAIGEGRISVAPTVHVNTEPLWMTITPQTVVDHVQITPEMTKAWMKYLAPLLADATNAEGTFSVSLGRAEIPLMDPMTGTVDGEFTIHGAALGPGPLATQFIQLASQIKQMVGKGASQITDPTKTWVQLTEQRVAFQVAENRVFHEGFQMVVDGVPIRTRGSVSLVDDSIAMMAEVPIMDEWIEKTPALAGLKGQVIKIPVNGTTSRPQLDQSAIAQVSTQLARQAATGYLQNEVGKQLQKKLGVGNVDEAIGGVQEKLNNKLQNELGKQLNKLFK